ncbi:MAG: single-strand DNA-binding protein [Flavobacteriaceae bacterium]|jgi:single-strand DNA-binding protein
MGYKAEGKVEKIFDSETKGASFQVRQFVIEVSDGQYPQMVAFQLVQDKCTLIDDYSEGDMIEVEFDLRGREWNGKYFTNLQAWRIGRVGEGGSQGGSNESPSQPPAQKTAAPAVSNDFDDDIPF